ncbi:MAG: hypothetical protein Pyrs2KO_12680 [Pyruvatibacter sp.]
MVGRRAPQKAGAHICAYPLAFNLAAHPAQTKPFLVKAENTVNQPSTAWRAGHNDPGTPR